MIVNTIGWVIVVLGATPGGDGPALHHQPRTGPVIPAAFRRDIGTTPTGTFRVWVFFTDKNIRSTAEYEAALAARKGELSQRALHRRSLRRTAPGLLDHRDLAPAREYVTVVCDTGVGLRRQSRWLNAVSVEATPQQIEAMARLLFVRRIKRLAHAAVRPPLPAAPHGSGPRDGDPPWYGQSYDQLHQINVVAAHNAGYTADGILIGILDTGFRRTHDAFNQPGHVVNIVDEYDFVDDDDNTAPELGDPEGQHDHGTYILGTLGAYHPNILMGGAYDAAFLLAKTEDITQEVPEEEDQYVLGLEWIEANGADMATSSLGYIDWYDQSDLDGQTATTTVAVNTATANGLFCCTAAGNSFHDSDPGTSHLIAPADAFEVLTCGAVYDDGWIVYFSSDGPTADGRVKPEVLARGYDTRTVAPWNNTDIVGVDGTSLSTPLVAGAVALILQAHPDWTVDKVRRSLLHTAEDFMADATYDPYYVRGYGILDAMAAIEFVHSDIDDSGAANGEDVRPFVEALLGTNPDPDETRRADINADGAVDMDDIPVFISDLLGE